MLFLPPGRVYSLLLQTDVVFIFFNGIFGMICFLFFSVLNIYIIYNIFLTFFIFCFLFKLVYHGQDNLAELNPLQAVLNSLFFLLDCLPINAIGTCYLTLGAVFSSSYMSKNDLYTQPALYTARARNSYNWFDDCTEAWSWYLHAVLISTSTLPLFIISLRYFSILNTFPL